ncbi:HINT domain-containing protein [Pendulispora brunnea]|uniref:HINT domain-containing protein n=1 Tax=Pendulispora brunnea TaxID=2905690 RepID=A0ABZ2KS35_9BACT
MSAGLVHLLRDRRGVSSIEYALLLFAILLVVGGGYRALARNDAKATRTTTRVLQGGDSDLVASGGQYTGTGSGGGASGGGGGALGGTVCDGRSCGAPGGNCFVAGTPVWTARGEVAIENVANGDLVLSRDEKTGDVREARVVTTFSHVAKALLEVVLLGSDGADVLSVTPEHVVWSRERGWIEAGALAPGETLLDRRGNVVQVESVTKLVREAVVYNFEVEATHTYFVGHLGTWVHNACNPFQTPTPTVPGMTTYYTSNAFNHGHFSGTETFWMNQSNGVITLDKPPTNWLGQTTGYTSFNGQYVGLGSTAINDATTANPHIHTVPGMWDPSADVVFTDTLSACTVVVYDSSLLHVHALTLNAAPYNGDIQAYLNDPQHGAVNKPPAFTVTPQMYSFPTGVGFLYGVNQDNGRNWYLVSYPHGSPTTTTYVGTTTR